MSHHRLAIALPAMTMTRARPLLSMLRLALLMTPSVALTSIPIVRETTRVPFPLTRDAIDREPGTVLVFGAGGGTGKETVHLLEQRGYHSVGMLRADHTRRRLPYPLSKLTASWAIPKVTANPELAMGQELVGDVCNLADVQACFEAARTPICGVVVALGGDVEDVGENMLTVGTKNIIQCMHRNGVERVAVVTSVGVGDSYLQAPPFFKTLMKTVYKRMFIDKNRQEELFTQHQGPGADTQWCIVRPAGLSDGPAGGAVVTKEVVSRRISRADVAAFCVDVLTEPNQSVHLNTAVCIQGAHDL